MLGLESALIHQMKAALLGLIGLLIVYAMRHSDRIDGLLVYKNHMTFASVALLSVVAVFFPHVKKEVLNSETFMSPIVSQDLGQKFENDGSATDIIFTLKCSQARSLLNNFAYGKYNSLFELYEPEKVPDAESIKEICSGLSFASDFPKIPWQTNTSRPHELCFALFDADLQSLDDAESGLKSCIDGSLLRNLRPNPQMLADKLQQLKIASIAGVRPIRGIFYSLDQAIQSYSKTVDAFWDNKDKWKSEFSEVPIYLGQGSSTGHYTHHYAVILQSFSEEKSIVSYGANQYGFGPLLIARTMQEIGSTPFDSVIFAVFVGNATILLAMFFLFWNVDVRSQVILFSAFILSLALPYWQTSLFAPMTYHLRLLPSLILFLYLTKQVIKNKTKTHLKSDDRVALSLHIPLAVLIAVFNFEYGVLTAFGMILASVTLKKWKLAAIYFVSLLGSFAFKSFAGGYSTEGSGTNLLGYVSSYWVSGPFDLYMIIISIAGLIPVTVFMFTNSKNRTFEEYAVAILFFVIMFKPAFVGSANHSGSVFITTACLAVAFLMPRQHVKKLSIGSFASYLTLALLMAPMFLTALNGRFGGGHELSFDEYQYSKVSEVMPISSSLATRMRDAESIFAEGDLLLSISDSAFSLWTNKKVAQPFFDVSSSILMPISRPSIEDAYSSSRSIVVDKIIADADYRSAYLDGIQPLTAHGMITPRYWEILDAMVELWDTVQANNQFQFEKCDQSAQFVRFCLPLKSDVSR